jgi:DNA-binding CsgD family transcriptional regulator
MLPTSFIQHYAETKRLTRRESQIIEFLLLGFTNSEIGTELNLKEQVVKNYLKTIFDKTGIKNRVALVADVYDMYLGDYPAFMSLRAQFDIYLNYRTMFETWLREAPSFQEFLTLRPKFTSWLARNAQLKQTMGVA